MSRERLRRIECTSKPYNVCNLAVLTISSGQRPSPPSAQMTQSLQSKPVSPTPLPDQVLFIDADGLHSRVRTTLPSHSPHVAANQDLPVRFLGVSAVYPADPANIVLEMRALDPFFFQGGDPQSDAYMWFPFVDTPSNNSRSENPDTFDCRVMIGWSYWKGFLGREEPFDVSPERSERLALMKRIAEGWADPFRECVMEIPADTAVQVIRLEDLVPRVGI